MRGDAVLGADAGLAMAEHDRHVTAVASPGGAQAGGRGPVAEHGQAAGGRATARPEPPDRPALQRRPQRVGLPGAGGDEQHLARGEERAQPDRERLARHLRGAPEARRGRREVDSVSATRRTPSPGCEPGSLKATWASRPSPSTARSTGAVPRIAW